MIRQLIMSVLILFVVSVSYAGDDYQYEKTKDYTEYTEHQKENLSFNKWWRLFKQYAKDQGERVSETNRKYYEINYYDEGYFPDEAFNLEYEGD